MELKLNFGALAPGLSEQLKEQGLEVSEIEHHENIRQSILVLWLSGYISDSQKGKMVKKLFNEIKKGVRKIVT